MHASNSDSKYNYEIQTISLTKVKQDKDLSVITISDLKTIVQCLAVSKKANISLGFFARHLEYKTREVIIRLYILLVRPHTEYAFQFWSYCFVTDETKLETL